MSPARRFLLAGLLVAAGEVVLAVAAWESGLGTYLLACAAATAGLALATHRLLVPRGGGQGGAGGIRPSLPKDPEPPWWPQFDHAFRAHVHDHDRSPV